MNKKLFVNMGAALAMSAATIAAAAPAEARRHYDRGDYYQGYNGYNEGYVYRDGRRYDARVYNGRNDRYRVRCRSNGDGTIGAIIGAIAGGLLGRSVDTRGERATGTILGAGAGALIGSSLDRNDGRC